MIGTLIGQEAGGGREEALLYNSTYTHYLVPLPTPDCVTAEAEGTALRPGVVGGQPREGRNTWMKSFVAYLMTFNFSTHLKSVFLPIGEQNFELRKNCNALAVRNFRAFRGVPNCGEMTQNAREIEMRLNSAFQLTDSTKL